VRGKGDGGAAPAATGRDLADLVLEGVPGDGEPFPQALDTRGDEDERRGADELGGGGSRRAWR
jgi:hypothetical protein